ncbi:hypothetical protein C3L33_23232, partial [Rhododendron williamsianum]
MAEIAVSAAKVLVPMVLHSLSQIQNNQKDIQKEVADLGVILHRLDAYLADMDGKEGNEQHKERVKEVREAAYHIEDVLEEFMFYVPHRFHQHTISYKYDELAYAAKLWNPFSSVHELLSKITGVKGMINNIVALDKLGSGNCRTRMEEGSTSGSKPDHQVAPNFPGDEEIVGFEERGEALSFKSAEFIHNLTGLPWPVAWDLFCKKAFQSANEQCPPELEDLSQKIVKRCEGLPLAIVAVDLPTHLKSCFLYFCIFPEDYSIDRGTLVRLWIAEGFVPKTRGETLEEVAEYYLSELIKRNLVHTSRLDLDGQARYCRVLNLVHEFINRKSEEVNFFSLTEELDASSSNKVRRLCIDCITLSQSRDLNYVRSAFLFKRSNVSASSIEQILRAFKLVKIKEIPNSIKKLSYLETLDLKQTKVTVLPDGILQLRNLRHLLVYWYNIKNYVTWHSVVGVKIARGIGALTNLQKLSLIKSDKHHEIVKELKALTQLRKLGLVDLNREGGKHLCESVEKMEHLSTLDVTSANKEESLDLDDMQSPPRHLRRLYLKGHLRHPLDALQKLPNLLELEMVDAFTGGVLVFEAGRFKKLKILHIEQFEQLIQWL